MKALSRTLDDAFLFAINDSIYNVYDNRINQFSYFYLLLYIAL